MRSGKFIIYYFFIECNISNLCSYWVFQKKTHDQVFSSFDLITQAIYMQKKSRTPIFETETHRFVLNTEPFLRVIRKPRILSPKFRFIILIIITLFKGITSYISFFPKISFLSLYNFYFLTIFKVILKCYNIIVLNLI